MLHTELNNFIFVTCDSVCIALGIFNFLELHCSMELESLANCAYFIGWVSWRKHSAMSDQLGGVSWLWRRVRQSQTILGWIYKPFFMPLWGFKRGAYFGFLWCLLDECLLCILTPKCSDSQLVWNLFYPLLFSFIRYDTWVQSCRVLLNLFLLCVYRINRASRFWFCSIVSLLVSFFHYLV